MAGRDAGRRRGREGGGRLNPLGCATPPEARDLLAFWFADATASPERASARSEMWFGAATEFATAVSACNAGFDAVLHPVEAAFLYVPFQHAENLAAQDRGVALFEALVVRAEPGLAALLGVYADYARRHREVIRRFGRFPHRNTLLGRQSTWDEVAYLRGGGETFA